ncbi:MAG TPA: TatD family hydrolase [Chthoniobacterales bacterium]|jgi:TatD DNase family protein
MLIDTHAHLDYPEFASHFSGILQRAADSGVTRMISIATGIESSRRNIALAEQHPSIFPVIGIHPNNVDEEPSDFLPTLRQLAAENRIAAIGETGLDYYRLEDHEDLPAHKARQADFFRQQLELAAEFQLNVVIHQRAAWDDTVTILSEYGTRIRAVFHCFGEDLSRLQQVIEMGHLVSFTGIATFKNGENMRSAARNLAPGQFMVETDCPYLAPVPFRGKRCEPAHTRLVAETLAAARSESLETFAAHTTATAEAFFKLPTAS